MLEGQEQEAGPGSGLERPAGQPAPSLPVRPWRDTPVSRLVGLVLLAVVFVLLALFVGRTQNRIRRGRHTPDFQVFYRAAVVAARGGNPYESRSLAAPYPYVYPPLVAASLRPMTALDFRRATLSWNLFQLLLLLVGFEGLRRLGVALDGPVPTFVAGASVAVAAWFLEENIFWAQVNLLVWVVILWALLAYVKGDLVRSGLLVSLGFCVKLVPGLLVLMAFGLRGRRVLRFLAGLALGLLLFGLIVPGLVDGFGWTVRTTGRFLHMVWHVARAGRESLPWGNNCANKSLLFALHHLVGMCAPEARRVDLHLLDRFYGFVRWIVALGTLAGGALALGKGSRFLWGLFVSMILLAMILGNPITWPHHFVYLTPVVVLLGAIAWSDGKVAHPMVAAAAVFLAGLLSMAHELEDVRPGATAMGALLLWVVLMALLFRERFFSARDRGRDASVESVPVGG